MNLSQWITYKSRELFLKTNIYTPKKVIHMFEEFGEGGAEQPYTALSMVSFVHSYWISAADSLVLHHSGRKADSIESQLQYRQQCLLWRRYERKSSEQVHHARSATSGSVLQLLSFFSFFFFKKKRESYMIIIAK